MGSLPCALREATHGLQWPEVYTPRQIRRFAFGRSRVRKSARSPAFLARLFYGFLHSLQQHFKLETASSCAKDSEYTCQSEIKPRPLPATPFPIRYSLAFLPLDTTYPELLVTSLKKYVRSFSDIYITIFSVIIPAEECRLLGCGTV
jgi:hypothetical protein